jgi:hypothetical protein
MRGEKNWKERGNSSLGGKGCGVDLGAGNVGTYVLTWDYLEMP